MDTKVCSKCNIEKELNEYYSQNKKKANGEEYIYYIPECKECSIKRSRIYTLKNHEEYLAYKSEYNKQYFNKPENKLKHREIVRKSREKGYQKEWQRNNPDKVRMYNENRKHKNHDITNEEWELCKEYFNYECAYCGITENEAKEQQGHFFHKEHVHHNGSNDLSNCVPSCRNCNSSKHDSEFLEWYKEGNENFSLVRLEKIHNWLDNDYKKFIISQNKII